MKVLVVVDMQRDFINGALGTSEAEAIVPKVAEKIRNWDGAVIATRDTHAENYMDTREGKYLPVPHCIIDTKGHKIDREVMKAFHELPSQNTTIINKPTFGSTLLPELIRTNFGTPESIELCGLCTGICVLSNAILLKAHFPDTDIAVDASCCACVTPESHKTALEAMKLCQIEIVNEE